ncbi:hypothetical protein GRF29_112g713589 [Pseudopithomyces chartarum]|uniref:Uncharacterized protein n=1 Tax=Pseudopithomyces chartarum TaxID=1892770 RepID=A0AAN6RE76_9PLEO|nr:hypothetical protein GRF29_112g713589 [Pseudopithomyces chartarum]
MDAKANIMTQADTTQEDAKATTPGVCDIDSTPPVTQSDNGMLDLDNNTIAYGKYIADRHTEIVRLTTENAHLIEKCAQIQKRHAETVTKYKDTHGKYEVSIGDHVKLLNELRAKEENHNKRLNERKKELHTLTQSLHKRIKEKDEAIQQVETLTHENANLCRIHADLGQESAELKKENANLINTVYPLQARISELQTEVASLRQLREVDEKDRKDWMTESEVARGLVRGNVIQACARGLLRGLLRGLVHDNVIQGCARDLVQQPTVTAMVETRGRAHTVADPEAEMIAERERHIGKYTPHSSIHRKESSGANRQGTDNFSTSPRTADDPTNSRRIDFAGFVWKKNTSQTFDMENVPKGPKAKSSSMFDEKGKSLPNEKQPPTKDGGYRR